jgi:hypothetical protein
MLSLQDKTFGLKNKKGAKQQKFIQIVEKQVKSGGQHNLLQTNPKKDEKEKKLKEAKEMAQLFKPVQTQKIEPGRHILKSFSWPLTITFAFCLQELTPNQCFAAFSKLDNVGKVINLQKENYESYLDSHY